MKSPTHVAAVRAVVGLLLALAPSWSHAELVRVAIASRVDVLGGKAFGDAGPYEKIWGKAYFAIDPGAWDPQLLRVDSATIPGMVAVGSGSGSGSGRERKGEGEDARARIEELRDRLPERARAPLDAILVASARPDAVVAAIESLHSPMSTALKAFAWDMIGAAIVEYASSDRGPFSVKLLRSICDDLAHPRPAASRGARTGETRASFAPGHVNDPQPQPWCADCGEGVPAHFEGGKRGQRLHAIGCSQRAHASLQRPA